MTSTFFPTPTAFGGDFAPHDTLMGLHQTDGQRDAQEERDAGNRDDQQQAHGAAPTTCRRDLPTGMATSNDYPGAGPGGPAETRWFSSAHLAARSRRSAGR